MNRENANPSNSVLRKFVLKLGIFLLVFGAITLRGNWNLYAYWAASWALILSAFLAFPRPLIPPRRVLIRLGHALGIAFTYVLLAGVYFLVLIPLGLAAKIAGKKFLVLKPDQNAATYWTSREPVTDKAAWERQY